MKAKLIVILLLINYFHGFSQKNITEAGRVSIGLKGGANFCNLNGNPSGEIVGNSVRWENVEKSMVTGFHLGLLANFALTNIVSLQPELLYTKTGVKYDYSNGGYRATIIDNFNYLQFHYYLNFHLEERPSLLIFMPDHI